MSDGVYLAIETSGPVGSLALGEGPLTVGRIFLEDGESHVSALLPALERLLDEAGRGRSELAGIVVGSGPGSFTGVRVAAAAGKGLVRGLDVPLWAFSSLAAAALADRVLAEREGPWQPSAELEWPPPHETADAARYVLFDARGERVYAGCYRSTLDGLEEVVAPQATTLHELLDGNPPEESWFCGRGALRHRDRLAASGRGVLPPPAGMPTADGLLELFRMRPEAPPVEAPGRWDPEYLKGPGAARPE